MRTACIGMGNVGRSWALVFARAGWTVRLWDISPAATARALTLIRQACEDLAAAGLLDDVDGLLGRLNPVETLAAAAGDADYIQESAVEDTEAKRALFREIGAVAPPSAIVASSTSAIPGSAFLNDVARRERALIAHPVNPPHLIPLVEICPSPWTSPEVVERTRALMHAAGQSPVVLKKEVPGFLLNRLQWALLGEALHLVGERYCSPDDIDRVLTQGLALRWAFIGPFEVAHLNADKGVQGYFDGLREAIARVQHSLQTCYPPSPDVVTKAHAALSARTPVPDIPERQAWRDRRLMALRRHLSEQREAAG